MINTEAVILKIGRRAAELRIKMGLTQDSLANKAGVTGGYFRQIEGGWKDMRVSTLCKVADMLGCHPRDLFVEPKRKQPGPGRPRNAKNV